MTARVIDGLSYEQVAEQLEITHSGLYSVSALGLACCVPTTRSPDDGQGSPRPRAHALEQAIARDLAARTSSDNAEALGSRPQVRRVVGVAAAAAGAVGLLGVGVAAAVVALDEDEVEAGLPGGSVIFIATDPTCTAAVDPDVFDCVLARSPLNDILGRPFDPSTPTLPVATLPPDWTVPLMTPSEGGWGTHPDERSVTYLPPDPDLDWSDSIFTFVDAEQRVVVHARGVDPEGIRWTCFAGQRAVDERVIDSALLGQYQPGPAYG